MVIGLVIISLSLSFFCICFYVFFYLSLFLLDLHLCIKFSIFYLFSKAELARKVKLSLFCTVSTISLLHRLYHIHLSSTPSPSPFHTTLSCIVFLHTAMHCNIYLMHPCIFINKFIFLEKCFCFCCKKDLLSIEFLVCQCKSCNSCRKQKERCSYLLAARFLLN